MLLNALVVACIAACIVAFETVLGSSVAQMDVLDAALEGAFGVQKNSPRGFSQEGFSLLYFVYCLFYCLFICLFIWWSVLESNQQPAD
jgi:hypothetical protein